MRSEVSSNGRRSRVLGWRLCAVLGLVVAGLVGPSRGVLAANGHAAAAGSYHSCAITTTGALKCWGSNSSGQLGDGTTTDRSTPTAVTGLASGVTLVVAGDDHTCALTAGGGVKCWGYNTAGQIGDGTVVDRWTPVDVSGLTSGVSSLATGSFHACALTTGGGVKCWGDNSSGQLGDGTTVGKPTPVNVSGLTSGVAAIAAGFGHTCALTTAGGLKCWGFNGSGQIGDNTLTSRPTPVDVAGLTTGVASVEAGGYNTCAVTTGGAPKCWGDNFHGQVGDGSTTMRTTAVDVTGLTGGVSATSVGGFHACAMTAAGVKCWGWNHYGQLGDGTKTDRATAVAVARLATGVTALVAGDNHTCALTTGGGIKCWGQNTRGEVGDGTTSWRSTPTNVWQLASGLAAVAVGHDHTCALTSGGGVKCWGDNSSGQLGDGTTVERVTPIDVSGLTSGVAAVSAGLYHTCALTTGGGVMCWGDNFYGQLGNGAAADSATAVSVSGLASGVTAISAGDCHTCALLAGGGLKCWGINAAGQLGDGTTVGRTTPVDVSGLTGGVSAVAAGKGHTCALTTGGGVKCWGQNTNGQLGDGTATNRTTAVNVSGLTSGVSAIATGFNHSCAVTAGGGLLCWGLNDSGQLGDGTTTTRATAADVTGLTSGVAAVAGGNGHTCALTTGGGLRCWGQNASGQLGDGTSVQKTTPVDVGGLTSGVAAVGAGTDHTCALTTGGGVMCWGDNENAQLGERRFASRLTPYRVFGFGRSDFDADDKADLAVYRPAYGTWFSLNSGTNNSSYQYRGWGVEAQGDTPVPGADFDGDGIIDPTVYRPGPGTWFVLESHAGYTTWDWFGWGVATDTLVAGDYDGDGVADAAVYRPSTATWYVRPSSGAASLTVVFGRAGDVPIAGDFDGDGKRDPAVYRASTGTWFWLKSSTNYTTYDYKGWGVDAQGDTPAPGDYDGDGKTDMCVFRPATGTWFILQSSSNYTTWTWFGWGTTGDQVVPADYDADGITDAAIYRAGTWYIRPSSGATPWSIVFGNATDRALVSVR